MTLLALLQARNEERFLPGWLANVADTVDGIVALDDGSEDRTAAILGGHPQVVEILRNPPGQDWDERGNQIALVEAGRRHGASWLLCLDADERMERSFRRKVRRLIAEADRRGIAAYSFQVRDLWGDRLHYREDGVWGQKAAYRLFRNDPTHTHFDLRLFHRLWMPMEIAEAIDRVGRPSRLNLYHLRMITAARREARADRYETLDPEHRLQSIGYRYLTDPTELKLKRIPFWRGFLPADDPSAASDTAPATPKPQPR